MKISSLTKFNTSLQQRITRARSGKAYRYLGTEKWGQTRSANEITIEERIHQYITNYTETELHAKNKITATGALVVPVLRCTFCVINLRLDEIKTERKTRKVLTMYKMHH